METHVKHRDPRAHSAGLLALCRRGVDRARRAGADQAEVCAEWQHASVASIQQNDFDQLSDTEETLLGVRVVVHGRPGFATANRAGALDRSIEDAIAIARATAPDPWSGFHVARGGPITSSDVSDNLVDIDSPALAQAAVDRLRSLRSAHPILTIDSGDLGVSRSVRAMVSSEGVEGSFSATRAYGNVFGMAIEDDKVGSFAYDGAVCGSWHALGPALDQAFGRFVRQAVDAVRATRGASFRGDIILMPSAAADLLISPLMTALSGARVRRGQSPFGEKVGEAIAAPALTIFDEGLGLPEVAACPFDRDGAVRTRRRLVDCGVLRGLLYSQYEANAAHTESTASALGGASRAPYVGVAACSVNAGSLPLQALESAQRCVVVPRFAGTTDHVTGDFSGVVKGGYLVENGARRPIHETTIAGNVYDCLRNITGISQERESLSGHHRLPSFRVANISITAG
ncbi:MAG: tldD/pmbA family protein [Deltaproteobacteria bacterium]|nr:tldD/pmbA family protein [Deltaproteobacteria bacterium]